jgi:hypothetical protein
MIVSDKFVFVHLPRTGGTFVTEVIKKFFPSAREIGRHLPRELLPRELSHLPILGTIRNPWEFYVSLYHYILPKPAANTFVSWMTDAGSLDFEGSVRNLLNLGVNNERIDALIELLPDEVDYSQTQIPNVSKGDMSKVRGSGLAYLTYRFDQMFGNADDVFFCRLETLNRDLVTFFEQIGLASDELRDHVLALTKKNASEHFHYSTYYSPELEELVSIRDRPLIEKFGYVFEEASSVDRNVLNAAI